MASGPLRRLLSSLVLPGLLALNVLCLCSHTASARAEESVTHAEPGCPAHSDGAETNGAPESGERQARCPHCDPNPAALAAGSDLPGTALMVVAGLPASSFGSFAIAPRNAARIARTASAISPRSVLKRKCVLSV